MGTYILGCSAWVKGKPKRSIPLWEEPCCRDGGRDGSLPLQRLGAWKGEFQASKSWYSWLSLVLASFKITPVRILGYYGLQTALDTSALHAPAPGYRDDVREDSACKTRKLSDSMSQSPKKREPERVKVTLQLLGGNSGQLQPSLLRIPGKLGEKGRWEVPAFERRKGIFNNRGCLGHLQS